MPGNRPGAVIKNGWLDSLVRVVFSVRADKNPIALDLRLAASCNNNKRRWYLFMCKGAFAKNAVYVHFLTLSRLPGAIASGTAPML